MARVVYQTPVRVGNTTVQVERTENMCEDWNWRTVKLIGFIIGAFAVLWWIFNGGRAFERYFSTTHPTIVPVVTPAPTVGTTPVPIPRISPRGGGKKGTIKRPPPAPPSLPPSISVPVVNPPSIINNYVEGGKVELVLPPNYQPSPPILSRPDLPPNKW